jgi:hypothetical protein
LPPRDSLGNLLPILSFLERHLLLRQGTIRQIEIEAAADR